MADLRSRFMEFPWIPSFMVSLLAGLVLYFIENPEYVPGSVKQIVQQAVQYGIIAIALGGLVVGSLSLIYNYKQKHRWHQLEKELEKKSSEFESRSTDVTKSSTELLIEWINKVEDFLWISDDGEITITTKNLNDAQKIILYLIGKRYAFELDLVESPEADLEEIAKRANVPHMVVQGWYLPLDNVINKYHLDIWERDEGSPFDKYQLNIDNVDKAFHYVTGDEELPEPIYLR